MIANVFKFCDCKYFQILWLRIFSNYVIANIFNFCDCKYFQIMWLQKQISLVWLLSPHWLCDSHSSILWDCSLKSSTCSNSRSADGINNFGFQKIKRFITTPVYSKITSHPTEPKWSLSAVTIWLFLFDCSDPPEQKSFSSLQKDCLQTWIKYYIAESSNGQNTNLSKYWKNRKTPMTVVER